VGEDYLNPVSVAIANKDSLDSSTILKELSAYLRQSAFIYEHQWQDGDYLIADNFSLLHGRNAFQKNSKRHLRRIQIL
jgi:alpha-ketoglutarate-dependent taurine dioxygenase